MANNFKKFTRWCQKFTTLERGSIVLGNNKFDMIPLELGKTVCAWIENSKVGCEERRIKVYISRNQKEKERPEDKNRIKWVEKSGS